jgi:hypothetical protein
MAAMRKYPYSLDEPLLWFAKNSPWRIRDALEGTAILGDMGSGKTSGSGKTLAKSMLNAGFGGLVLCKKTDECQTWVKYAHETGRQDQLLIVNPRYDWRFNFLEYQFKRVGEAAGYIQNAVALFMNLIENRREGSGQTGGHNDRFWTDGARRLIHHSMEALLLAGEPVSMDNLKKVTAGLPYSSEGTGDLKWPQSSYLKEAVEKADARYEHGWDMTHLTTNTPADVAGYFLSEFARPGANRQSAGILSTWTGMADPFMSGPVKELFCTTTNFVPEFSRRGAVIILDLPLDEWEEIGRTAQLAFKYIWQRCVLRRQGLPAGEVPVFYWADEAANFITTADQKFQEASRSSVCATVLLSQNINNYMAAFHENAEPMANALLAGLGTKIFHRNGDYRTNEWAAETIAKGRTVYYSGGSSESRGMSQTDNWGSSSNWGSSPGGASGGGGRNSGHSSGFSRQRSQNEGWNEQMDYQVQPELFTRLKSGGPENRNEVQAVIFRSGAKYPPLGKPFTGVTFKQG